MPQSNTHLTAAEMESLLRSKLTPAELQNAERHLDGCQECCEALERAAADVETWRETRDSLNSFSAPPGVEVPPSDSLKSADRLQAIQSLRELLDASDDPRMMGRFAGYDIVGLIGQGGMGVVLKAFDAPLNRYVAIKVLSPSLAASSAARRRFAREAQAAAAVVHENVVAIHGVSQWRDLPYLVMTYVRGESLESRIKRAGPLSVPEILRVAMQCAVGLAAAHAQGLVHRDVKPGNILLEDGVERLRLTDFGLARAVDDSSVTRTGFIAGTPLYMSPEQARGEAVDARSDLFGLGSVMYAMASGRPPFRGETSFAVLRGIVESPPRPLRESCPDVPAWLDALIFKFLAKDPRDRPTSAEQAAEMLRRCLAHVQQPLNSPLPDEVRRLPIPVPAGRHRGSWLGANSWRLATSLAALGLAGAVFLWPSFFGPSEAGSPPAGPPKARATRPASAAELEASTLASDPVDVELRNLFDSLERLEAESDAPRPW